MQLIDILISGVLALIMFGIGSSVKLDDFKVLFKSKKVVGVGLSLQMIFLPIFAFLIAYSSGISPEFKVGLFIVAICPGGTTSNFISYIVKADVALSIALTSINSVLILVTIPLLSKFAIMAFLGNGADVEISVVSTFYKVIVILFIPAISGVMFNEKFESISKKIQKTLKYINTILLAIVFAIKFFAGNSFGGSGIQLSEIFELLPFCLLLHVGSMILSYLLALKLNISNFRATTIGIEVGLQNTTLALLVTGTLIGNNEMTKPALVYAIFSFFTTLIFAALAMKRGNYYFGLFKGY